MHALELPIIDCHTHIGCLPGIVGDRYSAADLAYIAEREGVAFMLASSASATMIAQQYGTAETVAMVERYGDRLGGMLWINPHDPTWREDVPRAAAHGFYGIKIHPVLDHYEVTREALDEVFACAHERGWPILAHIGPDDTPTSALRYEPLLRAYPDVPLILGHLPLEAILVAKRYEHAYGDTTHVPPLRLEIAYDVLGPNKILFGTDAPAGFDVGHGVVRERPRRSYRDILAILRQVGIPDSALEKILSQNARPLFGIP